MSPKNINVLVKNNKATEVDGEKNAGDFTSEMDSIVRTYRSKRAVHTRCMYAENRERGGPASRLSFEEWAGYELDTRMDRHVGRMKDRETTTGERVELIALEELYARAEFVAPATRGYVSMAWNGNRDVCDGDDKDEIPVGPAERLEWDFRRSSEELADLQRLFVVTWRKRRAALRRRGRSVDNTSCVEAVTTTVVCQYEGDETSATVRQADVAAMELESIGRAYKSKRAVHTRCVYEENRERGGPASRLSFKEWAGYELDTRMDRHVMRMKARETSTGQRVELIALEELYARAEFVAPATRGYVSLAWNGNRDVCDGDFPVGPAERLEWNFRRSNDELTALKRLFTVAWRKRVTALSQKKREQVSAGRVHYVVES